MGYLLLGIGLLVIGFLVLQMIGRATARNLKLFAISPCFWLRLSLWSSSYCQAALGWPRRPVHWLYGVCGLIYWPAKSTDWQYPAAG